MTPDFKNRLLTFLTFFGSHIESINNYDIFLILNCLAILYFCFKYYIQNNISLSFSNPQLIYFLTISFGALCMLFFIMNTFYYMHQDYLEKAMVMAGNLRSRTILMKITHQNICIRNKFDYKSFKKDEYIRKKNLLFSNNYHLPFSGKLLKRPNTMIYWPKNYIKNDVLHPFPVTNIFTYLEDSIKYKPLNVVFYVPNKENYTIMMDSLKRSYDMRKSKGKNDPFPMSYKTGCYHFYLECLGLELCDYMYNDVIYYYNKEHLSTSKLHSQILFQSNHLKYYEKNGCDESCLLDINPLYNLNFILNTDPKYSKPIFDLIDEQIYKTSYYYYYQTIYIPILCSRWLLN